MMHVNEECFVNTERSLRDEVSLPRTFSQPSDHEKSNPRADSLISKGEI